MRIAIVSNLLPSPGAGGAERYAAALAGALTAGGHEVVLCTGDRGELPGVSCLPLRGMPRLDHDSGSVHKALWHVREQWLPAVHRDLRAALRSFRPDVVHSQEPQLLSAAVFTAVAAERLAHVHTAHDYNLLCARVTMTKGKLPCMGGCIECRLQRGIRVRAIQRRLDLLIAPSDFVRNRHLEHGVISPDRALTIRQGAVAGRRRLRSPASGKLRLGFLGALSEHKGVRTLLRAAASMPADWSLTLAGAGPLAGEVRAAAARDRRIRYVGVVEEAEHDVFLDELDTLNIPSEWEEPAPLVAVEATVRGLPTVVSDRGGLPETPQTSVFAAGSSAALLGAVEELDKVPGLITRRSKSLLDSRTAHEWPAHMRAVEEALALAVAGV
jgi:glycosyltransferase involved in cell wall biosynthesis